ncbi:MAG TPA: DNA-3-methyladenine glycosylase [Nitrosopumilaceae archaeon]|nr:DNA-3-methyladenine glycosylase [Nitrosopumilaceae archaeon]
MSKVAVKALKKDRKLAKIIELVGEYKIKISRNYYESLVEAIITQQLTGSAAKAISNRFHVLYGKSFPKPIDVINTPDSKLRKTGLSRMKIKYIKELSKAIEAKKLKIRSLSKLSDEEVIEHLTQVKGIGRWTAEMFLIFSLGRMDVLPVGDLGLRKGVQLYKSSDNLPKPVEIEKLAEKWRPYRTVATWYLWKSLKTFDTIG